MKKLLLSGRLLSGLLLVTFLASCGKENDDPMKREQEEMDKAMAGVPYDTYKAFKVALRGTAAAGEDTLFDKARLQLLTAAGYVLVQSTSPDSTHNLQEIIETAKQAKVIADAVPTLIKTDEDSLPTILQNILFVLAPQDYEKAKDPLTLILNEDEEHMILAAAWVVEPQVPAGLCLYELARVDDDSLRGIDLRLGAKISRTILYYQNNWPYHAEKSADEFVALTEKEKDYLLKNPWPAYDAEGNLVSPEQAWHQLHGIALLLRGLCRETMEGREADALADEEAFVKEAEAGGLDNELTWSAGAYVAMKKEDKDNALNYLDKPAAGKNISDDERKAIKETREYVAARENDKAMNAFDDKFAIVSIAGSYAGTLISKSKPMQDLRASKAGQEFLRLTKISPGNLLHSDKLNADSLIDQSKSLLKKIGI